MKWAETERVLSRVFLDASGLKTIWLAQKEPVRCNPQGRMQIRSVRSVGHDYKTHTYDATRDKLLPTIHGSRRAVWSVSVESTGAKPGESAWVYIENFRTNLRNSACEATLDEFAIGIASIGDSTVISVGEQDRMVMRSTVDVVLNLQIEEMDCAVDFIETVVLSSQLFDSTGNLLPVQYTDYEVTA